MATTTAAAELTQPPEPWAGATGSLVLLSDVACPWATVMVLRLRVARTELGLDDEVPLIRLAHPLEWVWERPWHAGPSTRRSRSARR